MLVVRPASLRLSLNTTSPGTARFIRTYRETITIEFAGNVRDELFVFSDMNGDTYEVDWTCLQCGWVDENHLRINFRIFGVEPVNHDTRELNECYDRFPDVVSEFIRTNRAIIELCGNGRRHNQLKPSTVCQIRDGSKLLSDRLCSITYNGRKLWKKIDDEYEPTTFVKL